MSLTEGLADIPDPHSGHGSIHPLPAVLSLVILGLLLGRQALAGIARQGRQYGPPLAQALGFRRGKTPTKAMLSGMLRRVDATAVATALSCWVQSRLTTAPKQLSLEGKTLKASWDDAVPGHLLVAAYAPQVAAMLAQLRVDAKTNEHKAALQLLVLLPLAGKMVGGDALFCQRDVAEVVAADAHYVFIVKDNLPRFRIDVAAGFAFEVGVQDTEAAFSPGPAPTLAGTRRLHSGPRARPRGKTHPADHHDSDSYRTVAGLGAEV